MAEFKELTRLLRKSAVWPYPESAPAPDRDRGMCRFEGPVVDLVKELCVAAEERGLTISRWQTNDTMRGYVKCITWAAHEGPRPVNTRGLPKGALVVRLSCAEGKGESCQAYRRLTRLYEMIVKEVNGDNQGKDV